MIFKRNYNFAHKDWKGVTSGKKKSKTVLLTRTCPPGLALAGPDMSKFRLFVQFRTFGFKADFLR